MTTLSIDPNKFKKQFVIYHRDETNDLGKEPLITDETQNRNCFLYDKATRTLFQHSAQFNTNVQLIGNTFFGTTGKHNENHNDYNNNKIEGDGSFGSVFGTNNKLNYDGNGGFVVGHYNNPNSTYLFTIGNGQDENNRNNLVQATENTFSINGDLEINGKSLNTIISEAVNNETIQNLQTKVNDLETLLNSLINELKANTILVDENPTDSTSSN